MEECVSLCLVLCKWLKYCSILNCYKLLHINDANLLIIYRVIAYVFWKRTNRDAAESY